MSDRYSFTSPFGRGGFGPGGQPWFRVGKIDVTTTVFLIGVGTIYLFIWAFESATRPISRKLVLQGAPFDSVGEVWRAVSWPVVNRPNFWVILLFFFFFMFGSQMEGLMGRRHYTAFIALLVVVPGVLATLLVSLLDVTGEVFGLRYIEMGVLAAFAAQYPQQRFIFNIPAPVFVGGIFVLDALQLVDIGNDLGVLMLFLIAATALIGLKSLGYAGDVPWIPAVPLPASMTGSAPHRPSSGGGRRRRSRRSSHLSAVSAPPSEDPLVEREIDALLDQVAERGLDSLTKEQRQRLEDHSRRLRRKRDG